MKAKANGNYTEASFSGEISARERVTKDQISWERLSRALLLVWVGLFCRAHFAWQCHLMIVSEVLMSTVQPQRSPTNTCRTATMWVINSDAETRQLVEDALRQYRQYVRTCLIFTEGLGFSAATPPPQVLLINVTGAAQSSLALLPNIRQRWPDVQVIFLSQSNDIHLWADAIREGAYDFLSKPIDPDQLKWVLISAFPTARIPVSKPAASSLEV